MRSYRLLAMSLLVCLTATVALAQDTYDLRYKFTPNQTDLYQITTSGTIPMDLTPGPEAGFPAMSMNMALNMTMLMSQLCTGVDNAGVGELETKYPGMTVHTTIQVPDQPIDMLMTWEKGVLTSAIGGQVQPADDNQKKMAAMLGAAMKMKMSPTGKTTPDAETQKLIAAMMNASGGMTIDSSRLNALTSGLPDHPVKIGDTWSLADTGQMGEAVITGSSNLKLTAIEVFEGVKTARIEGEARLSINGSTPQTSQMGMPVQTNITRLDLAMTFVNHFDLDRGNMVVSAMNLNQNMAMMISMGEGGAQQIHIPATIENAQMTVEVRRK
ncbi:MAG: DUF6263 family protein [Armatimonadota bacterium]